MWCEVLGAELNSTMLRDPGPGQTPHKALFVESGILLNASQQPLPCHRLITMTVVSIDGALALCQAPCYMFHTHLVF